VQLSVSPIGRCVVVQAKEPVIQSPTKVHAARRPKAPKCENSPARRENFDFDPQIAFNFCKKSILVNNLDVRLPPFPMVPSRIPASKTPRQGKSRGISRSLALPGKGGAAPAMPVGATFPFSEMIYPNLDAKMAKPASAVVAYRLL
jgi:hypothetical protein